MTDTERIDFMEAFATECFPTGPHVWVVHDPERADRDSQIAVPVRPRSKAYVEAFGRPHFNSLREALDAAAAKKE